MLKSSLLFHKSEIMNAFSLSAEQSKKTRNYLNWYSYSSNVEFCEKQAFIMEVFIKNHCDANFHLYTV